MWVNMTNPVIEVYKVVNCELILIPLISESHNKGNISPACKYTNITSLTTSVTHGSSENHTLLMHLLKTK